MKALKISILILILVSIVSCFANLPEKRGQAGSPIRVACDKNFVPFSFLDPDNQPSGMLVEVWKLWSQKTGREVQFVFTDWDGTIQGLKEGRVDVHSGLFENPARAQWMAFSVPFYRSATAVFCLAGQVKVENLQELAGKKVGAVSGSESEDYLKRSAPFLEAVPYKDPRDMISATVSGQVQAFSDEAVGTWSLLAEMGLAEKFTALPAEIAAKDFRAAVVKGNDDLMDLVNQGLSTISEKEMAGLEARWIPLRARRLSTGQ